MISTGNDGRVRYWGPFNPQTHPLTHRQVGTHHNSIIPPTVSLTGIDDLKILLVCSFISITVAASALYYIENWNVEPHTSKFASVPISGWWAVVTISTSGYGDLVPLTVVGRVIAAGYDLNILPFDIHYKSPPPPKS